MRALRPWASAPFAAGRGPAVEHTDGTDAPAHVWWADVGEFAERVDLLNPDELARMRTFRRDVDQQRYAARHAGLRTVLATVLGTTPREIALRRRPCVHCGGAHGRPALATPGPEFSLSRSGDRFAVALHRGGAIGLDIERPRARRHDALIHACCTPEEVEDVTGGDPALQWPRFLRLWCRKEAVLKATGAGIVDDLDRLDVRGDTVEAAGRWWSVADVELPDAVGAVAVEGPPRRVVVARLSPA